MNKKIEQSNKIILAVDTVMMIRHGKEKKFKEWEGFDEFSTEAVMIARTQTAKDILDRLSNSKITYDENELAGDVIKRFKEALKIEVQKIAKDYDLIKPKETKQ